MVDLKIFEFLHGSGLSGPYMDEMGCSLAIAEEVAAASGFPLDKVDPEGAIKIPYPGVRAHDGSTFCRYRQFSPDVKPKYLGLAGHAPEIYIPVHYKQHDTQDTLYITEGEKKAALLDSRSLRALGIPGVSAWAAAGYRAADNLAGEGLTEDTIPHKVILREALTAKRIIIIGDSDLAFNAVALHGLGTLRLALQKYLDNRSIRLIDDPAFNPINDARNIWVGLAILPPEFTVERDGDTVISIKVGDKIGVDDYFLRLRNEYEVELGVETATVKATAAIQRRLLSIALANLGRVESKLALVVAAENQKVLAHTAGNFRRYREAVGIWSDTTANEELRAVPATAGKYASAGSILAGIKQMAMKPLAGIDADEFPANIATWLKDISKSIKDLATIENDLGTTRNQIAILKQVSSRIVIPGERWDTHPDVFAVTNGVLDLSTGEFLTHSASRLLTLSSPAKYNPTAECPQWIAFLERVIPDPETRQYIQTIAGYSLTGRTNIQQFWFYRGPGGNGKGVYTNVMRDGVLGAYAVVADKNIIVKSKNGGDAHPTNVAALMGKRWVTFSELEENTHIDCGAIKSVTGGDMKTARKMRQDFIDFRPQGTFTCDTNEVPYISDTGASMRRRLVLVDWDFPTEKNPDQGLTARLLTEASGILNWALEGARRYYAGALHPSQIPKAVKESTAKLWGAIDVTQQWIESECIKDPLSETNAKTLFASHREWREANLNPEVSANMFGRKLRQAGFESRESHGQRLIKGLRLRTASERVFDADDEPDMFEEEAPRMPNGSESERVPTTTTKTRRMIQ